MRNLLPSAARLPTLTVATAVALWLLIVVGGVVRATESGLGCPDWPLCGGRVVPVSQTAPWIEFSHRLVALATMTLLALTSVAAWRARRSHVQAARLALAAVAFVPAQAILGAVVVWLEVPSDVVALHFVIGMTMVALMTGAAVAGASPAGSPHTRLSGSGMWLLSATLAAVVAGASVVASGAEFACGSTWPDCAGTLTGSDAGSHTQGAHRMFGGLLAASSVILLGTAAAMRAGRALALLLLAVVLVQVAVGAGVVLADAHGSLQLLMQVAHVAGAATVVVLAVLVTANRSARMHSSEDRHAR